ncbi:DegQ family serine endoprotease [Kaustia mangrovi]
MGFRAPACDRRADRMSGGAMRSLATLVMLWAVAAMALQAGPARAQGPQSVADLADELSDAVVNISTSQRASAQETIPMPNLPPGSPFKDFFDEFFNQQRPNGDTPRRRVNSLGSGFVIDPDGIVVTNNHVISDADEIEVNLSDGSTLKAELIGRDTKTDLALLRVEPEKPLTAVTFGSSDALRVGDWVMAIGNPFGLGGSVTLGIVSARNRNINAGPYDDFIQTDAAINRGNSGGPLFNMDGEVVGINTAIISPSGGSIGIGFAIPATTAARVIDQLRRYGEVRRGWLGVRVQTVTDDLAESFGLSEPRGALVADVTKGGPAEEAGIKPGDVIVEFDGKPVPEMRDLPRVVANTAIGKAVDVVVLRNGEEQTISVTLGDLDEGEKLIAGNSSDEGDDKDGAMPETLLGLELAQLTPEARQRYGIDESVDGVLIAAVNDDGPAADKGIEAGNVIVQVGQEPVSEPADVQRRVSALVKEGRRSILLLVANRDGDMRFLAIQVEKGEDENE